MMKLLNLTPHAITVVTLQNDDHFTVPPCGQVARLAVSRERLPDIEIDGLPVQLVHPTLGAVEGLPEPKEGVICLVSALVAEAVRRPDVMSPGELIRDKEGVITGCRGLCAY